MGLVCPFACIGSLAAGAGLPRQRKPLFEESRRCRAKPRAGRFGLVEKFGMGARPDQIENDSLSRFS